MTESDYPEIERIIGYTFSDKQLLKRCFIHSSYSNEHKGELNNERLEFLGDAVLELVFTEKLYEEGEDEGVMTNKRQRCVSDETLRQSVEKMGLDRYMICGKSSKNLGRKAVPSLLEAIAAGIYLDGGYECARKFILEKVDSGEQESVNYIGMLQEYLQGRGLPIPEYNCVDKRGDENSPVFTVQATALGVSCQGLGNSKKRARMLAARELLALLQNNDK